MLLFPMEVHVYHDILAVGETSGASVNAGVYIDRSDMNQWEWSHNCSL